MIARIAEGDKEDVDLAVKAARHAFDDGQWPRISGAVCTHNPFFLQFTHSTKLCHFLSIDKTTRTQKSIDVTYMSLFSLPF